MAAGTHFMGDEKRTFLFAIERAAFPSAAKAATKAEEKSSRIKRIKRI